MTALGYIFVTMGRDAQIPVADQQRAISEYGKKTGFEVEEYFIEQGCSLKSPFRERKEAARLLSGLRQGDVIITPKAEWVLGSAKEGARLIRMLGKQGVSLYCIDLQENISLETERKLVVSTGSSSLVLAVLNAIANCDGSKHGESIKATKRHQKREGKYLGGPVPFGWRVEGEYLAQDLRQQQVIREILALRADRWSYRDIAGKLKAKHNIKLSHEGIRRILANNAQKKQEEKKRQLSPKRKKNPLLVTHKAPPKPERQSRTPGPEKNS